MAMTNTEKCRRLRERRKASHVRVDLYLPKAVAERVALHAKEWKISVNAVLEQLVEKEFQS